jgi:glycosyltransferase involved in cell wall biosynthesis
MARILTLTSWYPPHYLGGYELSCFDVMQRFAARGHDVRVLCSDERTPDAERPDPAHEQLVRRELQLYLRDAALYRPKFRARLAIERHNHAALARQLDEHQPDVVSVWHMGGMSLGLLRDLADRGTPVVYSVCDDWLTYGEQLDAWTAPYVGGAERRFVGRVVAAATRVPVGPGDLDANDAAFCFISDHTRRRSVEHSPWQLRRSTVVYNGIDRSQLPRFTAPPVRPWRWRLLFTGRLDPRKGFETALRALSLLPDEAHLTIDGRGSADERARLEALVRELGVEDRVTLTTSRRDELADRYQDADVFLFPSEWDEPFGLTPLEAMACATPVVATAAGGSAEFLRDGHNCVVFPAGDPATLASAVRRVHDEPVLRDQLVRGGLHTADELDVEHFADALEAWHLAAAAGYPDGPPADRQLDLP